MRLKKESCIITETKGIKRKGELKMQDVVEFFRNLPEKTCKECGGRMQEDQCECYTTTCEKCSKRESK